VTSELRSAYHGKKNWDLYRGVGWAGRSRNSARKYNYPLSEEQEPCVDSSGGRKGNHRCRRKYRLSSTSAQKKNSAEEGKEGLFPETWDAGKREKRISKKDGQRETKPAQSRARKISVYLYVKNRKKKGGECRKGVVFLGGKKNENKLSLKVASLRARLVPLASRTADR